MQLIAGSILDGLLDQFKEGSDQQKSAKSLASSLCFFELNGPDVPESPIPSGWKK